MLKGGEIPVGWSVLPGFSMRKRLNSTERTILMITICSQCRRVIGQTQQSRAASRTDPEPISHGICSKCLIILEDKIREFSMTPPPDPGAPPKTNNPG
jgi:hypothetical protein